MSAALTTFTIRIATPADARALSAFARETFVDTFGAHNTASDMELYTRSAFGEDIQRAQLTDALNVVLLAEQGGELAGYALLRDGLPPIDVGVERAIEIDRLYVAKELIGSGMGRALMQRCLDEAANHGHDIIWLNVWEHNHRAIQF